MKKIVLVLSAASFLMSCDISGGNKGVIKRETESVTGATFNDSKPEAAEEDSATQKETPEGQTDSTAVKNNK